MLFYRAKGIKLADGMRLLIVDLDIRRSPLDHPGGTNVILVVLYMWKREEEVESGKHWRGSAAGFECGGRAMGQGLQVAPGK